MYMKNVVVKSIISILLTVLFARLTLCVCYLYWNDISPLLLFAVVLSFIMLIVCLYYWVDLEKYSKKN